MEPSKFDKLKMRVIKLEEQVKEDGESLKEIEEGLDTAIKLLLQIQEDLKC